MYRSVFVQFYILPVRDILALLAVATCIFLRLKEQFQSYWTWKLFLLVMFVGFTAVILHLTVSTREFLSRDVLFLIPFHSYREVINGGNPEILRSNFMNVVLFYPAGLLAASLLPRKWRWWHRVGLVFLVFAALSAGIEFLQYRYGIGRAEMDDVIHNSLGAVLGGLACFLPVGLLP